MRRFQFPLDGPAWRLLIALGALFTTRVGMAHSLHRPSALGGSLGLLAAALIALLVVRIPRRALRRLRAMRRERALFRSMAAGSRQASLVCEPLHGPGGTVFDFRILYTNTRGSQLLGSAGSDPRSLAEILPHSDALIAIQVLVRVLRSGRAEVASLPFVTQDGQPGAGACAMHVVPQSGCLVLTTLQSAEEKAAHRQVEELHDFTRAVFENAPAAIIATDINGVIMAMNESAEQLTQFPKAHLVGKHSLLRLHDSEELSNRTGTLRRQFGRQLNDLDFLLQYSKEYDKDDWTYVRRDGSHVSVHLTLTPLHTDGGISGYLAVAFDVTERRQLADAAFYMAHHDQLTGLPNRTLVRSTIETALASAREHGRTVAVFALDVDNFKRMNDSLGHPGGDSVLSTVASRIRASIQAGDFAARLGGDEFVLVFPDMRNAANAEARARSLLDAICKPFFVGQREVQITASIGFCVYPQSIGTVDDLLRHADLAMYAAKSSGRGRFAAFSDDMQKAAQCRLELEEALRHALARNEFSLHYQPQVTCSSGNVESMEMLLRWNNEKFGNIPPDVFIPIAREAGLITEIGAWSLRQACKDCAIAQVQLQRPLRVAVNLSPEQLQPELFDIVQVALRESGLAPQDLELELTEQVMISGAPRVLETLDRIRNLGASLAIDDFGIGFSNFSYILQYQVDRLKIDRSFVARVRNDTNAAAIVRTVIAMAHGLGLKVCAEGAETEEQVDFLIRRRCDEIQGFLFARPVPFSELRDTVLAIEQPARKQSRSTVVSSRPATGNAFPPNAAASAVPPTLPA